MRGAQSYDVEWNDTLYPAKVATFKGAVCGYFDGAEEFGQRFDNAEKEFGAEFEYFREEHADYGRGAGDKEGERGREYQFVCAFNDM